MKVSVVIPTYNRGSVVGEAIGSVLAQTYTEFEALVVDDGSVDETQGVVAGIADSRVRYLRHDWNRGCGAAYNTGFREARGELIAILDSDDTWKPSKLERQVRFLEAHSDIVAAFTDAEKIDGAYRISSFVRECESFTRLLGKLPHFKDLIFTKKQMYLCLLSEQPVKVPTLMFRAEALRNAEWFDESWPSGNDWRFLIGLSHIGMFGYIDEPLTVIRVQGDATHRAHLVRDHELMVDFLYSVRMNAANDFEAVTASECGMIRLFRHLAWHYLDAGTKWSAVQTLIEGFRKTGRQELLWRVGYVLLPDCVKQAKRLLSSQIQRRSGTRGVFASLR